MVGVVVDKVSVALSSLFGHASGATLGRVGHEALYSGVVKHGLLVLSHVPSICCPRRSANVATLVEVPASGRGSRLRLT